MRGVDLACGCGSASLGMEEAGVEVVWAGDAPDRRERVGIMNANAARSRGYKARKARVLDIASPAAALQISREAGEVDIVFTRASVPLDAICCIWPRAFIIEVDTPSTNDALMSARESLQSHYDILSAEINAARVGTPQARVCTYIIGMRCDLHTLGEEALRKLSTRIREGTRSHLTCAAEVLGPEITHFFLPPSGLHQRGVHPASAPAPRLTKACGARARPETYVPRATDSTDLSEASVLTIAQLSLLQGFPSWFDWTRAKSSRARPPRIETGAWIADSTPPQVARFLAQTVADVLRTQTQTQAPQTQPAAPETRTARRTDPGKGRKKTKKPRAKEAATAAQTTRRSKALALLGLESEPETEQISRDRAHAEHAVEFYTRLEDGRRQIRVRVGVSLAVDARVQALSRGMRIPPGWSFEVHDRLNKRFRFDDAYWIAPGSKRKLRSIAEVSKHLARDSNSNKNTCRVDTNVDTSVDPIVDSSVDRTVD